VTNVCGVSESGASDLVAAATPLNTTDSQIVDNVNQVAAVPVGDAEFNAGVINEPVTRQYCAVIG